MIERIFIDLDGVVADWESRAIELIGLERDLTREKLKNGTDFEEIVPNMWEALDKYENEFWQKLQKYSWSDKLVEEMQKYADVAFLSSGGNIYKRAEGVGKANFGKTTWVPENFNNVPLILTREKELLAFPNTLLIDDTKKKIDKFKANGGHTYHWPHAAKIEDGDIKLENVFAEIEELILNPKNLEEIRYGMGTIADKVYRVN